TFHGIGTHYLGDGSQVEAILTVSHGTLTVNGSGLDAGSTNNAQSIHLIGSEGAVNAALDQGIVYTPDANYNGSDNLTIDAHNDTTNAVQQQVGITVTPVNDAPVVSVAPLVPDFTTLDDPDLSGASAVGINDSGIIVGEANLDANHGRGWVYDGTHFTT